MTVFKYPWVGILGRKSSPKQGHGIEMSLQVTGKNIDVGESFQGYVSDRLDSATDKYVGKYLAAHVRVEKERSRFVTNCSVRLRTGLLLEASGTGADAYGSADTAFEHLEKRLRRYKRRLKNRHHGNGAAGPMRPEERVNDFVVDAADESFPAGAGEAEGDHPLVVAETERTIRELAVSEAVMQLDLTEDSFLVFRNAADNQINVVYRRDDGNIGWIDPGSPAGAAPTVGNMGAGNTGMGKTAVKALGTKPASSYASDGAGKKSSGKTVNGS